MLPKSFRLTRQDFPDTRVLKRVTSPHFSISYGPSLNGGIAVVISKKVARLAVSRHLLKRRILAVLRPYVSDTLVLVVHTRTGASAIPFPELKEELLSLVRSIPGILPAH
jgi:ribonuclease P protein component